MGRKRTGPPWSIGRPTAHAPGCRPGGGRLPTPPAAGWPARRQRYRQQPTMTDVSEQNNTGPLLLLLLLLSYKSTNEVHTAELKWKHTSAYANSALYSTSSYIINQGCNVHLIQMKGQ